MSTPTATDRERDERRERVLTQGTASIVSSISDAVVAKDGEPFFLCPPDGQLPRGDGHGYGLYHHDCRFLSGYELRLADARPNSLAATELEGTSVVLELTNADIRMADGGLIRREQLGITWRRSVDAEGPALRDEIDIRNFGPNRVRFPLELRFEARFEDVFEIRGLLDKDDSKLSPPAWEDGALVFVYAGADGIDRRLRITFDRAPSSHGTDHGRFDIEIEGRASTSIAVTVAMEERTRPGAKPIQQRDSPPTDRQGPRPIRLPEQGHPWVGGGIWLAAVRCSSPLLEAALDQSLADLQILRSRLYGYTYYEAGLPWFATLFGRDALLTALQTLAFDRTVARDTLRLLAARQADSDDPWRDATPGKILHELRIGELARLGEIPHTPYYGSVDATPLFLLLLARHAAWTGRLELFEELRDNVERALDWLARETERRADGYIAYDSDTERGLVNQGWKDSGTAIVDADGETARPPIALVEVQAYAYRAWLEMAELYERSGDPDRAIELRGRAREMRDRFDADYWSERDESYVLARTGDGRAEVVTSNAGHVLWAGLAPEDRARRVGKRLLAPDMFNGWGIRTLSTDARAYHPIGYHLGTVWPHDTALIADGFRRYGLDDQAEQAFIALLDAAQHFRESRLPECFAGYSRDRYRVPVQYPTACHPQAWAAGTIPMLLVSSLGIVPEAFDRRVRVVRPRLPSFVGSLDLRGLAVADARVDLHFERTNERTAVDVVKVDGDLRVEVEDGDVDR